MRKYARISLTLLLAVVILLTWGLVSIYGPVHRVTVSKRLLAKIEVGQTTTKQFSQLSRQEGIRSSNCEASVDCRFSIVAGNRLLQRLHISPPTSIEMGVEFERGVALQKFLVAGIGDTGEIGFVHVEQWNKVGPLSCGGHGCTELAKGGTALGISMDKDIEIAKSEAAFDVNAGCLSRIGGCKSYKELLPRVP